MKRTLLSLAALIVTASAVQAVDFFVYKITAKLPVLTVAQVGGVDKIVTRTFVTNDLINIALGRPLGTKVNSSTEILAVAGVDELDSVNPPASKLIVFNPSTKKNLATITTVSSLNMKYVSNSPRGSATVATTQPFVESTVNPTVAKFFAGTSLFLAGSGKGPGADPFDFRPPVTGGTTMLNGRVKLLITEKTGGTATVFEGLVVKGSMSGGGAPLLFSE